MTLIRDDVRAVRAEADELRFSQQFRANEPVFRALTTLGGTLARLEREPLIATSTLVDLHGIVRNLTDAVDKLAPELHGQVAALAARVTALTTRATATPALVVAGHSLASRPLLGVLPVVRVIPQDVHSVMDYAGAGACLVAGFFAESTSARLVGAALGASNVTVSALTDYKLSAAKVIPIETHEAIDYAWGAAAMIAPFALGYYKRDPIAAAVHVLTGAGTILASLVTDYRAAVGVGRRSER